MSDDIFIPDTHTCSHKHLSTFLGGKVRRGYNALSQLYVSNVGAAITISSE